MSGLKEIKNRITSVASTIQITSAMKMVSAAKLKKAQEATVRMRPYTDKIRQVLQDIYSVVDTGDINNPFIEQREIKNILIVVVSSNRGLCGAFNSSVVKQVIHLEKEKYHNANVHLVTIGKKAYDVLSKQYKVKENHSDIYNELSFKAASNIAQQIMRLFSDGLYDRVEIVYNAFKSAANTVLTTEQMLPIVLPEKQTENADYLFEPNKTKIIETLIPKIIKSQLYQAIISSIAAEHGSRMIAMHKATDNASELKNELLLTYNKARQASITNEILEIVAGAEALKS